MMSKDKATGPTEVIKEMILAITMQWLTALCNLVVAKG